MKKITVIGGGATGLAAAAHLTLKGNKVTLFDTGENIEKIMKCRKINFIESEIIREVDINNCTNDPKIALEDCEIVIVAVIAQRHEEIVKVCSKYFSKNQIVLITPGNLGSLVFYNYLKNNDYKMPLLAEVESNLYVCKKRDDITVELVLPIRPRYISSFPAIDTAKVIEGFQDIYTLYSAKNVLETTLNLPNIDSHVPGVILNVGGIERGDFYFYRDGLTKSVLKFIEKLYEEKIMIMKKLDCEIRTKLDLLEKISDADNFPNLNPFREIKGPDDVYHRYISEDTFVGMSIITSLGEMLGIKTPTAKALIYIASILNDCDYRLKGRTCENLGLSNMTKTQLNYYLETGRNKEL